MSAPISSSEASVYYLQNKDIRNFVNIIRHELPFEAYDPDNWMDLFFCETEERLDLLIDLGSNYEFETSNQIARIIGLVNPELNMNYIYQTMAEIKYDLVYGLD